MLILKRWASRLGMRLMMWAQSDPVHLATIDLLDEAQEVDSLCGTLRRPFADEIDRRRILGGGIAERQGWPSDQATGTQP